MPPPPTACSLPSRSGALELPTLHPSHFLESKLGPPFTPPSPSNPHQVKILKKHDKRTGLLLRAPYLANVLQQPFYSTRIMSRLVKDAEGQITALVGQQQQEQGEAQVGEAAARQPQGEVEAQRGEQPSAEAGVGNEGHEPSTSASDLPVSTTVFRWAAVRCASGMYVCLRVCAVGGGWCMWCVRGVWTGGRAGWPCPRLPACCMQWRAMLQGI